MAWTRKHLLGLEELSKEEIVEILDTAATFKEVSGRSVKKVPALRGKVVVNLFFESSTRTSNSFALAAARLSADTLSFTSSGSIHCRYTTSSKSSWWWSWQKSF